MIVLEKREFLATNRLHRLRLIKTKLTRLTDKCNVMF